VFFQLSFEFTFEKIEAYFFSEIGVEIEEIDFPMNKVQKTVVYRIFYEKYSTYRQKRSSEVLNTNYTGYVKI
jgi:hypothetical protein